MPKTVAVLGAGILGRALAFRLAQEGFAVSIFERNTETDERGASFVAGGMLAPFCELEHAPECVARFGVESISILKNWISHLSQPVWLQTKGTLVVAHHRDRGELERLCRKLEHAGYGKAFEKTERGLFFPEEAHVCPQSLMRALLAEGRNLGACYHFSSPVSGKPDGFDLVIDCRGLGAKEVLPGLRGVRGEVVEVECHEIELQCPVRLMHPKYPVYIIPRPNHHFVIGATVIESEKIDAITVQSLAELLSAAMTVHPGFAEANLIAARVQCRPAFADHLPCVFHSEGVIRINGLYRHGYLLSPYVVERVVASLKHGEDQCWNLF